MSHEAFQVGSTVMMLVAIGISVAVLVSAERSRTNVLIATATILVGLNVGTIPVFANQVDPAHPELLARLQGLLEVGAIVAYAVYLLELQRSSSVTGKRAEFARASAWTAIGLSCWHAIASFAWPAQRLNDYQISLADPGVLSRPGFWLFAVFWLLVAAVFAAGWLVLWLGELDPAEAGRALASVAASPVIITVTASPPSVIFGLLPLWISLSIWGQLRYTSARAERGVFLSRFLSPRVTELVATRGLAETMKPRHAEITVVCADLRGFTSYSEGVPSQAVVDLLAEYYDAVGEVAGRHGATITNYAGDGVLIVVGAPLRDQEHAATGVQLARDLLVAVEPVLSRWQTRLHTLGLGIGVASGDVTVGAISAETRMEYTAIGMPVNLAARLCAAASSDEVLVDATAARLSNAAELEYRGDMEIKGFSEPQQVHAFSV